MKATVPRPKAARRFKRLPVSSRSFMTGKKNNKAVLFSRLVRASAPGVQNPYLRDGAHVVLAAGHAAHHLRGLHAEGARCREVWGFWKGVLRARIQPNSDGLHPHRDGLLKLCGRIIQNWCGSMWIYGNHCSILHGTPTLDCKDRTARGMCTS